MFRSSCNTSRDFSRPCFRILAVALIVLVFGHTSCGGEDGGGDEIVYLFVFHGYPGSATLDLVGPTGPVVQGLPFAERSGLVAFDRSLGSNFTLRLNGTPQPIELSKELFSLYPRETATLFITRRSGDSAATATVYRHLETIDSQCIFVMGNSLSLDNGFLGDAASFNFFPEWNLSADDAGQAYNANLESQVQTECGPAPVPSSFQRADLAQKVAEDANRWFASVENPATELQGDVQFVSIYGGEGQYLPDGQVLAPPPSSDYVRCLQEAVSVNSAGTDQTCPDGALTESDITFDQQQVQECRRPRLYTAQTAEAGAEDEFLTYVLTPRRDNAERCGWPVRIRTGFTELIFNEERTYFQDNVDFPVGRVHFFVLYGRPTDPFAEQWTAEGDFISNPEQYDYPNRPMQ